MTVESVTYISDLNATNPAGTDTKSEGDDHIRNIKTGLNGTFSNFAGAAMTATEAELNNLDGYTGNTADLNILAGADTAGLTAAELQYVKGATSDIQTQLNTKYEVGGTDVPISDGGTGSSSAAAARTNLGIGTVGTLEWSDNSTGSDTVSFSDSLLITAGLYVWRNVDTDIIAQVYLNGAWQTIDSASIGFIWSDGTNMRWYNNHGSIDRLVYWIKLA